MIHQEDLSDHIKIISKPIWPRKIVHNNHNTTSLFPLGIAGKANINLKELMGMKEVKNGIR